MWRLSDFFYMGAGACSTWRCSYAGSLIESEATAHLRATDHVGVGLRVNDFGFRFDIKDRGNFDGRLRWDYGGAVVFATVMF